MMAGSERRLERCPRRQYRSLSLASIAAPIVESIHAILSRREDFDTDPAGSIPVGDVIENRPVRPGNFVALAILAWDVPAIWSYELQLKQGTCMATVANKGVEDRSLEVGIF